jgi:FkbM family methyltransferase
MVTIIPHRRPFLGKLRTSVLKRRVRLAWFLARWRRDGGMPMTCRYFGAAFAVGAGELIGDEIAVNRYEWRELTMMLAACREYRPRLFIDVGANIGVYSCILGKARAVPRLIAFEPDRQNFARLVENIGRNGLEGMSDLRPFAVGAKAGTAYLVPGGPDNSGLSKLAGPDSGGYGVAVVALDGATDIEDSVICAKIDVEGYELEVLAGAARLFRHNSGYVQIEGHGDQRAAEIAEIMREYGWQFVDRYGLDLRFVRTGL